MANKTTVYPDWVQKYREKGTTVKKVGNTYYLYKRTSKRVPGKKNPQPVDKYMGIITPEGIVKSNRKKIAVTNARVREYGFSKIVWELCPDDWKIVNGEEWEDRLAFIIQKISPETYLEQQRTIKSEEELDFSVSAQMNMLSRRLFNAYKVDLQDLSILKNVYIIYIDNQLIISEVSKEQKELLEKLSVSLEYK